MAWSGNPTVPTNEMYPMAGIPNNCIYLARLTLDDVPSGGVTTPAKEQAISQMTGSSLRILMRDVYRCKFRRTTSASMQIRLNVYNYDPDTGKALDGTLRRNLKRGRQDGASAGTTNLLFDLTSAVPIPALTLLPGS